jgi:hypothetical protein
LAIGEAVLSNIDLDPLDRFVETQLIPDYTRGQDRAENSAYKQRRTTCLVVACHRLVGLAAYESMGATAAVAF